MPVTVKLSRELCDRLGERVADELVDWFNSVDTAYRADLRQFNELNFQRFDAKLEQRLAQFAAELDARFVAFEARLEARLEAKLEAKLDAKFEAFEVKLEAKLAPRFAEADANLKRGLAELETRMERRFADLLKWCFVFWIGTIGTVVLTAKLIP